jgi:hypothetical protein
MAIGPIEEEEEEIYICSSRLGLMKMDHPNAQGQLNQCSTGGDGKALTGAL